MKSDHGIYAVTSIAQPAVGETIIDPAFGTPIKRITDCSKIIDNGNAPAPIWAAQVEYSTSSPFSCDGNRLLLMHGSYFVVYDGDGHYLFDPTVDGRYEVLPTSEPRWSAKEPSVFFYLKGNELKAFDVSTRQARIVRRFDEYVVRTNKGVGGVRGLGEQDLSETGQWFGLCGQKPDGTYDLFLYDFVRDRKSAVLARPEQDFDNLYATPDGNVTLGWNATGRGRFHGEELFDKDMNFVRQLAGAQGHKDVGRDANGRECLVWVDAANPAESGGQTCSPTGPVKIDLKDGSKTCLLSIDWNQALHVYVPYDAKGWALLSLYTTKTLEQAAFYNEILKVSLDGSGTVERLAHHRSSPFSYGHTPRASGNRDLTKIVFNSSWGSPNLNYTDVYMIDLAPSVVVKPPANPPIEVTLPVVTPPAEIDQLKTLLATVQSQLAAAQTELTIARAEARAKDGEIAGLRSQLQADAAATSSLRGSLAAAQQRIAELEAQQESVGPDPARWHQIDFLNPSQVGRRWGYEVLPSGGLSMSDVDGPNWAAIDYTPLEGNQWLLVARNGELAMLERVTNRRT